jgi:hypothetical protein
MPIANPPSPYILAGQSRPPARMDDQQLEAHEQNQMWFICSALTLPEKTVGKKLEENIYTRPALRLGFLSSAERAGQAGFWGLELEAGRGVVCAKPRGHPRPTPRRVRRNASTVSASHLAGAHAPVELTWGHVCLASRTCPQNFLTCKTRDLISHVNGQTSASVKYTPRKCISEQSEPHPRLWRWASDST